MNGETVTQEHTSPIPPKWIQCNGRHLQKLAQAGLLWLEKNVDHVNALNVFPVPDGDTGTNMLMTMRSAHDRIKELETEHVGQVAEKLAYGALIGGRGNSGVILSQIWRGFAKSLEDKAQFNAADLALAFQSATDTAYDGVKKPVEGTILTVIREGAAEAADAAQKSHDLRFVLERVLERCQQALARTPEQLPILKQAGVVDAGGQGLVNILEGMLRYVHGQMNLHMARAQQTAVSHNAPAQAHAIPEGGNIENPYDVQFLIMGQELNVEAVRTAIGAMGDSMVVVGDEKTVKVHIHVKDPGEPLSFGITQGEIHDVVVENMQTQMEEIVGENPAAPDFPPLAIPQAPPPVTPGQIGVVAVAAGTGLADVFRSMGVACVVNGGQTNNPSIEELFDAIQEVPTDKIILLPNNKNIHLAAAEASALSPKTVKVLPTRTAPQGISAMLAYDMDGELEEITAAMKLAATDITTGEITVATRSVTIDGVDVKEGATIALVDGKLAASDANPEAILPQLMQAMNITMCEIVTLYYGSQVSAAEAQQFATKIEALADDIEVELLSGGQPHYQYILSAE